MNFNPKNRSSLNPQLSWLWDILSLYATEEISVPTDFYLQVDAVKDVLNSDTSGLVNSILDFAINCATVDYNIETSNTNLTKTLNQWTKSINSELIGKIPIGLNSLSREYFRERWKGSSLLLLRTTWEKVDGFILPTRMWFVDGENVEVVNPDNDTRLIGEEVYKIKLGKNKTRILPASEKELIFVQKPFNSWTSLYSTPFIIQRGLYKNLKILELINKKGEKIIGKALEYMLLIKKGTEATALSNNPDFIYSDEDLKKVKDNFKSFLETNKTSPGTPTHVTNFDTEIEHLIPEYSKAMKAELYSPIEKRILAGLGLVEVVEGVSSTRRESILNPKPFIGEITKGISDFKQLLNDIVQVIIDKNTTEHRKYFASNIHIYSSPVKDFISDELRNHVRSMYDRGVISKRTYVDLCGNNIYFDIEVQARKNEEKDNLAEIMYPPIIQNTEAKSADLSPFSETIPTDKTGIEKLNYKGTLDILVVKCKKCSGEFDYEVTPEKSTFQAECPHCMQGLTEEDIEIIKSISEKIYEEAPYKTIEDLPEQIKVLPKEAQSLWMRVFNQSYPKGEDYARKVAWTVVKKIYKKDGDKWVKKSKTKGENGEWVNLETASVDNILGGIINLQKIELQEAQLLLAKKLLKENGEDK